MARLTADLRYALRSAGRYRTITAATVLTMALVIGAGAAVFSAISKLTLTPLAYPQSQQLVILWDSNRKAGKEHFPVMEGAFPILLDETKAFQGMAAFILPTPRDALYPEKLWGTEEVVSTSACTRQLFSLLRVPPILGRTFDPSEMVLNSHPRVAILSYSFWLRHYGGSRDVIGKTLDLNHFGLRVPYVIVGVMPEGFEFPYPLAPEKPDLWVDLPYLDAEFGPGNNFLVLARLKKGIEISQAQADVDTVAAHIRRQTKYFDNESVTVVPLPSELVRSIRPIMWVMLGAASCLLLIGCANTGNFFLARALSRERELAIRAALGAGRAALIRQMLTESLLVAGAGGVIGSLLAHWGHRALPLIVPSSMYVPRLDSVAQDPRLSALTAAVLVVFAAAFNVLPSLRLCRPNVDEALKPAGRAAAGSPIGLRRGSVLLIFQVGLALALLVGTTLLGESLEKLLKTNRGFQPENLLVADVGFSNAAYTALPNFQQVEPNLYHQFEERVKSLPGVRLVAAVHPFPLETGMGWRFKADGSGPISTNFEPAQWQLVTPSFFEIMNLKLMRGRWLAETDTANGPPVAVINRSMAERYWPVTDPLGRKIWPMFRITAEDIKYTVVGVVQEPRRFGLGDEPVPTVYQAFDQVTPSHFSVVIRTAGDPHAVASIVRSAALQMLPGQTLVGKVRTGEDIVSASTDRLRATTVLVSVFTFLALVLAGLGVYALVSYYTSQRTHEIGVRMSLGARRIDVVLLVCKEGMALVSVGTLLGVGLSFSVGRVLRSMLYETPPIDFRALCLATLFFLVVAVIAIYAPARRASKVDPMVVLRYE